MTETVFILDDDRDLLDAICEVLTDVSTWECVVARSYEEMVRLDGVLEAKVALLDINLGASITNGIDAYRWLIENGFKGRIYFFTGHGRTHPLVEQAVSVGNGVGVLVKPMSVTELMVAVFGKRMGGGNAACGG